MILQDQWRFEARPRGFHLVTSEVYDHLPELPERGLLHLFLKHTSAALTIQENADPSVRVDFESIFNHIFPENLPFLKHTMEGPDDMPSHIKSALVGVSLTIPIVDHHLELGTWQGIYLCEFRNRGGARSVVSTVYS